MPSSFLNLSLPDFLNNITVDCVLDLSELTYAFLSKTMVELET